MKRFLSSAAVALLAGCNGIIDGTCTLIGCDSGLSVQLAQVPVGAYRIEVFSGSGGAQDDIPGLSSLAVGVREGGLRAVVAASSLACPHEKPG
jgi:hypothetical protein